MNDRFLSGAALAATVAIAGAAFACAHDQSTSPQPGTHSAEAAPPTRPALLRTQSARVAGIRQRAGIVKRRGLSTDERTRVASLSAKFKWVGDVHHAAMQEGIHDISLRPAKDLRATAMRCEAQVRYLVKYFPQVEARTRSRFNPAERNERMRAFASQVGDCPRASSLNASLPAPLAPPASAAFPTAAPLSADTVSARWADYVASITSELRTAKSLDDAREMIDAHVAAAAADDSLSAIELDVVAAVAALTTSSAIEWDTYFRPKEESLFFWGWLSSLGEFIVSIIVDDAEGCGEGVMLTLGAMVETGWYGEVSTFTLAMGGACVAGGIIGSILSF